MNYTNTLVNGTLELLAGDSANMSTLVPRSESITTFASAIISDAMFNNNLEIRRNLAKNLNLTGDEISDFINKAIIQDAKNQNRTTTAIGRGGSHSNSTGNDNAACEYYCNGLIKNIFANYRNMHGYISLVVSTRNFLYVVKSLPLKMYIFNIPIFSSFFASVSHIFLSHLTSPL